MLRLLFTTKDLSKQMTVITDGIDSQMNVFVTENTVGDVEYYKSLGIVMMLVSPIISVSSKNGVLLMNWVLLVIPKDWKKKRSIM